MKSSNDAAKQLAKDNEAVKLGILGIKIGAFAKGIIIGVLIGALVSGVLVYRFADRFESKLDYAIEFINAILHESVEQQDLVVMEQPLSLTTQVTKEGLGSWAVFRKTKYVQFAGTGVYTVDLSGLAEGDIKVNKAEKTVTIKVPRAELSYINVDYDKVTFEDTEKGLLAFGDIKLTVEEQNALESSVDAEMRRILGNEACLKEADEFAVLKCWEIFRPLVSAVNSEYTVNVVVK